MVLYIQSLKMDDRYVPVDLSVLPDELSGDSKTRPRLNELAAADFVEDKLLEQSDYLPPHPKGSDSSNNQRSTPTPENGDSKVTLDPKESAKPVIADKQTLTPVTTGSHEQFVNVSRVADAHLKNSKLDTGDAGVEAPRPTAVVTPSNSGLRSASELTQTASDLVTGRIK